MTNTNLSGFDRWKKLITFCESKPDLALQPQLCYQGAAQCNKACGSAIGRQTITKRNKEDRKHISTMKNTCSEAFSFLRSAAACCLVVPACTLSPSWSQLWPPYRSQSPPTLPVKRNLKSSRAVVMQMRETFDAQLVWVECARPRKWTLLLHTRFMPSCSAARARTVLEWSR